MNSPLNRSIVWPFLLFAVMTCVLTPRKTFGANCYQTDHKLFPFRGDSNPVHLKVVAFGTSLTWGDGLKQESTYRYLVANYMGQQTKRTVELWTFAHSAAYLTDASDAGTLELSPAPNKGDLNGSIASVAPVDGQAVDGQADCALSQYSLRNADLILLDGCINEVNAVLIVAPWTNPNDIVTKTEKYCQNMNPVLSKLEASFPNAKIVVVNYFPIVSSRSSVFGSSGTHRLEGFASKVLASQTPPHSQHEEIQKYKARHLSRTEERNIMADNSELFYQTSKQVIATAINAVNPGGAARVFSAILPESSIDTEGRPTVDPTWAYGAPNTHEWLLPFPLFFGFAINPDDKFTERWWLCLFHYPFFSIDRLVNEMNAGFHPTRLGATTYAIAIENVIPSDAWKRWEAPAASAPPIQPAYSDLSPAQQAVFESSCKPPCGNPAATWAQTIDASQRLEFAGGTQALESLGSGVLPGSAKGLDVDAANNMPPDATPIVGSVPGNHSQDQFHIDAEWNSTAIATFRDLPGWSEHITWFHHGMFGYQQNKNGIPSGGLVVLFKSAQNSVGQFHIDMRFWGHFTVDNGNVAANYETYSDWYGNIRGYSPSEETVTSIAETETAIPRIHESKATPLPNLRESVTGFLKTWYIDQDLSALNSFVAQDNMVAYRTGKSADHSTALETWNQIFGRAFVRPLSSSHAAALEQVIGYEAPDLASGTRPLTYINAGKDGLPVDPFAIVDISSLPPGSLLPLPGTHEKDSPENSYLAHLVSTYGNSRGTVPSNLAIVIYMIKSGSGFVQETAVTYWIRENENGPWKLAGYHGTD